MPNPRLASRYAKALLDLSVEQNNVERTLEDIQYLNALCTSSKEFTNMLRSPVIKADKKHAIVNAVVGDRLSPLVQAFLKLLVAKGREENLPEISAAFITAYKKLKNIKTVRLTTATPAGDKLREAIYNKVASSMPEAKVELKEEVNEDILGGFILQMDDKLFDASIRRDLNDVKAQFQKNIYISKIDYK